DHLPGLRAAGAPRHRAVAPRPAGATVGRAGASRHPGASRGMTEPILQTVGLSIRFGGVAAVRGVNLCLAERELRCLIGPNGAGKSTLFKLLTGQLQPTSGRILFHGEDITGDHTHAIARRGIGIKTQVPNLFDGLTVREHLWLAARRTNSPARADAITDEILERVGLGPQAGWGGGRLSHGLREWGG